MDNKIFYYWAVKYRENWEKTPDGYKITDEQLLEFYNLLLGIKDEATALEKLPPYPLSEINDMYFTEIQHTKEYIKSLIDAEYSSLYYSGTIPP